MSEQDRIEFPAGQPAWDAGKFHLSFQAIVDGEPVRCTVHFQEIMTYAGDDMGASSPGRSGCIEKCESVFIEDRSHFEKAARRLIKRNHVDDGVCVIRAKDLTTWWPIT